MLVNKIEVVKYLVDIRLKWTNIFSLNKHKVNIIQGFEMFAAAIA